MGKKIWISYVNEQFILIYKKEILWHCSLETNVNIEIVMESHYFCRFRFEMWIKTKYFLKPFKIVKYGEKEKGEMVLSWSTRR